MPLIDSFQNTNPVHLSGVVTDIDSKRFSEVPDEQKTSINVMVFDYEYTNNSDRIPPCQWVLDMISLHRIQQLRMSCSDRPVLMWAQIHLPRI